VKQEPLKLTELQEIYNESEECDRSVFAEQRSNILLAAGNHYAKTAQKFHTTLRDPRTSENLKLRLTKNHIHKITRYYEHQILSKSPGVSIRPKNESEIQDKKSAELNQAVWVDAKKRHKLKEKIRRWIGDFVTVGEVACKITWDPTKGELIGYGPKIGEDGQPEMNEMGQMAPDMERPEFSGDFSFESIPGFDLLRSKGAFSMADSPYLIYRKMVEKKVLMKAYSDQPEKIKGLTDSAAKSTYVVFDQNNQSYSKEDKRVLVKEFYFRPCVTYPKGYFYICTEHAKLEEGELPYGIFPLVWKGFDEYPSNPRGYSIIKIARPFQSELNRASSQLAQHQVSVGDDKVIYQAGTKLQQGALLPGVRGISYTGIPPQILAGRDGSQFLGYIESQIKEMYDAVMLDETLQEEGQQMEPYTLLFRSMKQQIKFGKYAEKFGEFLEEICTTYLALAKQYLPDDMVIGAVGRAEQINMAEFRSTTPLSYQITVEEQTEAPDTQLGRQLTLNHLLQYVGTQLGKDDIGRVMKNMPFVNNKEIFGDLTIDSENVDNDMLAIERGENVDMSPYANNEYYVKRLSHRVKQPDFKFLAPQVQQNFMNLLQQHEQEIARKQEEIRAAQNEFIPVGGNMIKADMYVTKGEGKIERVALPYQAVDWLIQKLEEQGMSLEKIKLMNSGAQADIAGMFSNQQRPAPNGAGMMPGGPMPPGMMQ
jgi:hypothetical protein